MTAGVAAVITFMAWKLWRIARDPNVSLHQFQFKLKRSLQPSGWMFALLTTVVLVLTLHSGAMNAVFAAASSHDQEVIIPQEVVFSDEPLRMPDEMAAHADEALKLYERVSRVGLGGWSLFGLSQDEIDMRMARLDSSKLDFPTAEARLRRAIDRDGPTDRFIASLVWVLRAQQRTDEAMELAESHLPASNAFDSTMDAYVNLAASIGQLDRALATAEKRLAGNPESLNTMRWSSLMLMQLGRLEEGVAMTRRTIDIDPNNPNAYRYLAMGLADLGRTDEAIVELQKALQLQDSDPSLHALMSGMLSSVGRQEEAAVHQQRTEELMQSQLQPGVVHQH
jgi:tetratricopeptide (TPR) repeat protein